MIRFERNRHGFLTAGSWGRLLAMISICSLAISGALFWINIILGVS